MHQARPTDGLSGDGELGSPGLPKSAPSGIVGRAVLTRLGLFALSAVVAVAAGLATRFRWGTEPTAELVALLLHIGVLAIGVGGMLGVVPLPRGRRSGLGLALMATSMLVLFAAPAWNLGPLGTTGFLGAFVPGLWLVAGPSDGRRRRATPSPSEMPVLPGSGPPAPAGPAA
ncbi:MAG: hypothetical protein M0005_11630 [Actinomycetota bacterium]|nr:hypothetical protein [Actinomycetota bacterium]MDA8302161.1 hypothetical protein [Actinomycetota bacterium]